MHGGRRRLFVPGPLVAVADEVDRRQAQRPVGELAGHPEHPVFDPQLAGVRGHVLGDVLGDRMEDQRAQHHVLHDAAAEPQLAPCQRFGEFARRQGRPGVERDRIAGHGRGEGNDQRPLHRYQPAARRHGRRDPARDGLRLRRVGRREVHGLGRRQRDRRHESPSLSRPVRMNVTPSSAPCTRERGRIAPNGAFQYEDGPGRTSLHGPT